MRWEQRCSTGLGRACSTALQLGVNVGAGALVQALSHAEEVFVVATTPMCRSLRSTIPARPTKHQWVPTGPPFDDDGLGSGPRIDSMPRSACLDWLQAAAEPAGARRGMVQHAAAAPFACHPLDGGSMLQLPPLIATHLMGALRAIGGTPHAPHVHRSTIAGRGPSRAGPHPFSCQARIQFASIQLAACARLLSGNRANRKGPWKQHKQHGRQYSSRHQFYALGHIAGALGGLEMVGTVA